jgi:hypothetical protein
MKRPFKRRTIVIGLILTLLLAGTAFTVGRALDYMGIVNTYWRVHDDVLQPTEMGRYYIDLYWRHNYELCTLILNNPQVKDDGLTIILEYEPGLRALVEGLGGDVIISEKMVDDVEDYLDLLVSVGSPELSGDIQAERLRTPFDQFRGMSFEQARITAVGLPEEGPIPTPIDWEFPRTPEITPLKPTAADEADPTPIATVFPATLQPTPYSTGTP